MGRRLSSGGLATRFAATKGFAEVLGNLVFSTTELIVTSDLAASFGRSFDFRFCFVIDFFGASIFTFGFDVIFFETFALTTDFDLVFELGLTLDLTAISHILS